MVPDTTQKPKQNFNFHEGFLRCMHLNTSILSSGTPNRSGNMHFCATKIILLFAVIAGQLVGGSSCCCFARLLASTLNSTLSSAALRNIPAGEYPCPKCCQHLAESSEGVSTVAVSQLPMGQGSCSGNDKCNCVRGLFIGSSGEKQKGSLFGSRSYTQYNAHMALGDFSWLLAIQKKVKSSYSLTRCHWPANRDWQCIACIWTT